MERTTPDYAIGQALEMMSEGALIVDGQRQVVYANLAFTSITGYEQADILGRSCTVLHGPQTDESAVAQATLALAGGQVYRGEMLNYRKDRSPFWNHLTISPLRAPSGEITHFAVLIRDISEQKALEQELRFQAQHDVLTGLPNRAALGSHLKTTLTRHADDTGIAVGILDLDDFKPVNDRLGHAAGDELLRELAQRLRTAMRDGDFIARVGGDEFVLVLRGLQAGEAEAQLHTLAQRLHRVVDQPFAMPRGQLATVGMTLGFALHLPPGQPDGDQLLRRADAALYQAKQHKGRRDRCWSLWREDDRPPPTAPMRQVDDGLRMHFQPLVHLATGRVARMEALARLHDADGALRMPADFLPAFKPAELAQLFRRGLNQALPWLRRWTEAGLDFGLGVNLPPVVMVLPECRRWVQEALQDHGIDAWRLELELLEHDEPSGHAAHLEAIKALHALGVRLVMDDLGAGFSSLERLYKLPFHTVKIDQQLVMHAPQDPGRAVPFIGNIVRLAHSIGLRVVIEGLENRDLLEMAVALGADYGQGYAIARPMPAEDVLPWTRGRLGHFDLGEPCTPLGRAAALFSREALPMDWSRMIEAHRNWKSAFLRRAAGEGRPLDWRVIRRDDACQLGQWMCRCNLGTEARYRPLFERAQQLHREFHACAAELARGLEQGGDHEAMMARLHHGELDGISRQLVQALHELRGLVTTGGEATLAAVAV